MKFRFRFARWLSRFVPARCTKPLLQPVADAAAVVQLLLPQPAVLVVAVAAATSRPTVSFG